MLRRGVWGGKGVLVQGETVEWFINDGFHKNQKLSVNKCSR